MSTTATDPRAVGERIERLLEASSAGGPVARERAEELVQLVVELYGAGLERLLEIAHETGRLDDPLLDALADDELVSGLLLVHGLHPYGVVDRVARALASVQPLLQAEGAAARLLDVADGVVTVALEGGGHGCGSSSAVLAHAVEDAVAAAAPEVDRVVVQEPQRAPAVIPVATLSARLREGTPA